MHKKILLCLSRNQFEPFDYTLDYQQVNASLGGNSGNNVFQYSLQKLLSNKNNQVEINTSFLLVQDEEFYTQLDYINNNFDCLVFSPANVLSSFASSFFLKELTNRINKLTIPVYVIGLGAQSGRDYSLAYVDEIKVNATNFIKAVLNSGGKIGLRGYFTADVMKRLGFSEADFSVIGCPSLFMKGPGLKVDNSNISGPDQLITAINGFRAWNNPACSKYLQHHKSSFFVCQEEFYKLLYQTSKYSWREVVYLFDKEKKWLKAYRNNQIKLYGDFPTWHNDLKRLGVHFAYGCRIHGNIVPILAGIPAYVDTFDSRVRELGEYFNIPNGLIKEGFADPWELYQKTDYTKFNNEFENKYRIFEQFMDKCGLKIDSSKSIQDMLNLPNIDNSAYLQTFTSSLLKFKKVVFVAHEFGLYKGHGGIASYLYNISAWILNNTDYEVHIIASCYDASCDSLANPRFSIHSIGGDLYQQRKQVLSLCEQIQPDYCEIADFSALGLLCVNAKKEGKFANTLFVTNNHTATRECWEWSHEEDFVNAPAHLKNVSYEEAEQLKNSDFCIAPSTFLATYVQKHYGLTDKVHVFANPYFKSLRTKFDIRKECGSSIDFDRYKDYLNIILITRFEGRKHQERLIKAVNRLKKEGLKVKLHLAGNTSFYTEENPDFRMYIFKSLSDEERKDIYIYDFLNIKQQESLIALADLSVMPSTYENQPVAMVETVIRGVPVMGSIYSGLCDYTKDSSMLFDPADEDDLTNKIRNFYLSSPADRERKRLLQLQTLSDFIHPTNSIIKRLHMNNQEIINV